MKNIKSLKAFESRDDDSINDDIYRLGEILEEIEALMYEADELVRYTSKNVGDSIIHERWKAYPYNNIMAMLSSGSRYDVGFSDIIEELEKALRGEDDIF
jgi:hypothetical protein